jgi:hypothetical protein
MSQCDICQGKCEPHWRVLWCADSGQRKHIAESTSRGDTITEASRLPSPSVADVHIFGHYSKNCTVAKNAWYIAAGARFIMEYNCWRSPDRIISNLLPLAEDLT